MNDTPAAQPDYEQLESMFIAASQGADAALFAQGDVLALAKEHGYSIRALCKDWQAIAKVGIRTLHDRYKVAVIFPPDMREPRPGMWSLYMLACKGCDIDDPDTWIKAHERMEKAITSNWTFDQMKTAIAAENPRDPEPELVPLFRGQACKAVMRDGGELTLLLPPEVALAVPLGEPLVVTMFQIVQAFAVPEAA